MLGATFVMFRDLGAEVRAVSGATDEPGQVDAQDIVNARRAYFESRGADLDDRIRPSIARSWRRSLGCRIAPDQPGLHVAALPRVDRVVYEIVESVAEEFVDAVSDVDGIVTFTDSAGALALVRASTSAAEQTALLFPVGAILLEELIGTTSDGIVLEERQPAQVWSGEHLLDLFQGNCCTSVPVLDPITRTLVGVLTLTVGEEVADRITAPALLLLVSAYAWKIQMRVEEATIPSERHLLHDFLREYRKRGSDFVIASDGKVVITSTSFLSRTSKNDVDVVLSMTGPAGARDTSARRISSSDGSAFVVSTRPVDGFPGVVATLKPEGGPSRSAARPETASVLGALIGQNEDFLKAVRSGLISVRQAEPLIFAGEFGVGKAKIATSIAEDLSIEVRKFECTGGIDDVTRAIAKAGKRQHRRMIMLQRVELLDEEELDRVVSLARQAPTVSLVCTAENRLDSLLLFSTRRDINFIYVPSLRRRRDDIPLLIEHFLEGSGFRMGPALQSMFTAANWPGNIQQLRKVLAYAGENASREELTMRDLDETDRKLLSHGRLTRLEEAELDQIRGAFFEAQGNKSAAATLLEIGRSTLYRRVDYFLRRGFDVGDQVPS